jgi:hypothetical protein
MVIHLPITVHIDLNIVAYFDFQIVDIADEDVEYFDEFEASSFVVVRFYLGEVVFYFLLSLVMEEEVLRLQF